MEGLDLYVLTCQRQGWFPPFGCVSRDPQQCLSALESHLAHNLPEWLQKHAYRPYQLSLHGVYADTKEAFSTVCPTNQSFSRYCYQPLQSFPTVAEKVLLSQGLSWPQYLQARQEGQLPALQRTLFTPLLSWLLPTPQTQVRIDVHSIPIVDEEDWSLSAYPLGTYVLTLLPWMATP